jgi:DNA polymerase-3 subunit alpha
VLRRAIDWEDLLEIVTAPHENPRFTHLHAHSSYSVGIGLATPEELCAHAKRSGYGSLALTDINGTYGYLEFHLAAKKHGIKPIYGAAIYHTAFIDPSRGRFSFNVLACNRAGLRNVTTLTTLSAAAYESGVALSLEQLAEHSEGMLVLVGTVHSEIAGRVFEGDDEGAAQALAMLKDIFDDRVYVEIQDHGDREERALAQKLLALAEESRVAPVLSQEIRYTGSEMRGVYGLLTGIRHPHEESDFFKIGTHHPDRSMRAASDMEHLYSAYPQAYRNTHYINERIPVDLFAHIDHPSALLERLGDSQQSFLDRCTEGFYRKYKSLTNPGIAQYQAIIENEVGEITQAGLISTFLLYHNIISKLRRSGISLGPATGVSLQSLCAYLLDITGYDPYLYTEHFRPMFDSRIESMTELEIQLTSDDRDKAVELLRDMIGGQSFAYVPAIERITPARAVRMVAGIVDIEEKDVNEILKIIGRHPGIAIKELSEEDRQLGRVYKRSVPVRELLTRAALLEGLPSGFIKSRRSVAFSAGPLTDYLAHSVDADTGDIFIHVGRDVLPVEPFLRIDFTPLTALDVTDRADADLERVENVSYGWDRFPKNDSLVWQEVHNGDTTGVFLFEGQVVQQQRESIELRSIEELTNLLALLRFRGDEGTLAERIEIFRRGEIFSGSDPPEIFRTLRATRGHVIYDEQLRDILSVLTGADTVEALSMLHDARAIDPATLSRVRGRFMRAMADQDAPMESATTWFERVLFYAKQTIRRERVLADAILVYKMFYLKVYHPGIFHKALLNANQDSDNKLKKYLEHLDEADLLLALDINRSDYSFEAESNKVRTGFCVVQGLEQMAVNRIIKARGRGGFRSVDDFVRRTRGKGVNKDVMRKLVEAGAFDSMGERGDLLELIGKPVRKKRAASKPPAKTEGEGQLEIPFDGEP